MTLSGLKILLGGQTLLDNALLMGLLLMALARWSPRGIGALLIQGRFRCRGRGTGRQ